MCPGVGAIALIPRQSGKDCVFILRHTVGKRLQVGERTACHCREPRIQSLSGPRAHHLDKLLDEEIGKIDLCMQLSEPLHQFLLLRC